MSPPAPQLVGGSGDLHRQRDRRHRMSAYRWNFDDGTPVDRSGLPSRPSRTSSRSAGHLLRDRHRDRRQRRCRSTTTVVQAVHLPLTAQSSRGVPPTSCSRTAPRRNARLWVVNQDNDSVSVFDAVTQRETRRDHGRHRAAHARHRAERRGLGDQQAERDDQRHQPVDTRRQRARSACRAPRSRTASRWRRAAASPTSRSRPRASC